ncbi:ATP12 family protein [Temperatibacter marinus]|uniref:ATP12 family protein n=1 Tax=Temperatibacter marinus TaxID=1456591 RepID=A0AA52EEF9_9PROT|nr:ATP12 family protein [Temperatibacter marinus]WND01578.1 ATP12 family protein [Temperatibacter marinus]
MKRFYKSVAVIEKESGYSITLDQRNLKTPLKASLVMPTRALAAAVAEEWEAQEEIINTEAMPLTKLANTAIDRVNSRREDIIDELSAYSGTDLICYYAEYPEMLVERQKDAWSPYHGWLQETYGVTLKTTSGIIHVTQEADVLSRLKDEMKTIDSFRLTALHGFTTGLGSFTMGLSMIKNSVPLDTIWPAALVDELFQEEEWGADEEAVETRKNLYFDMQSTEKYLTYL